MSGNKQVVVISSILSSQAHVENIRSTASSYESWSVPRVQRTPRSSHAANVCGLDIATQSSALPSRATNPHLLASRGSALASCSYHARRGAASAGDVKPLGGYVAAASTHSRDSRVLVSPSLYPFGLSPPPPNNRPRSPTTPYCCTLHCRTAALSHCRTTARVSRAGSKVDARGSNVDARGSKVDARGSKVDARGYGDRRLHSRDSSDDCGRAGPETWRSCSTVQRSAVQCSTAQCGTEYSAGMCTVRPSSRTRFGGSARTGASCAG
eukprot:1185022-Prorocentrum_minimum.AAC.1